MILQKKFYNIFIFILIFLAETGCVEKVESLGRENGIYSVRRVIDGDTIELSDYKLVRYIGIDTSEIRKKQGSTWLYDPEPYSIEAKDLNKMLVESKQVKLEFDVERQDKYGRWLAYVYVDDKMVNEELLKQGYAKIFTILPNIKHIDRLKTAQFQAKQAKRGIWQ